MRNNNANFASGLKTDITVDFIGYYLIPIKTTKFWRFSYSLNEL